MLKRFLKFFKPSEEEELPQFEGSYLDYLLREARPGVAKELDLCSEHDPLLLVVVQVLRGSMRGVWSDTLIRPLQDQHSPKRPAATAQPPKPPKAPTAPATTLDDESSGILDDDVELLDEADEEEDAPGSDDRAEVNSAELGAQVTAPNTGATPSQAYPPGHELGQADSEVGDDGRPRADRKEVLQAGRVFLGMLIENDRLPPELQLGVEEILLARDLLMSYFMGSQNFESRAQKLLKIVEQKFSEGLFSQSRILLQLFQTDPKTRVRNDRNIFYEDMIQRFGIKRRRPVAPEILEEFEGFRSGQISEETNHEFLRWIEDHLYIKTHLFMRHQDQVTAWRNVASKSTLPQASESLLRYLPPRRWRPIYAHPTMSLAQMAALHVGPDTMSTYVMTQLQTCYFVLRAVGDTGLEAYLDSFFNWTDSCFQLNGTVFLPELYRRSMADSDAMRVVFQDLYDRYFRQRAERLLASYNEEQIAQAFERTLTKLRHINVNDISPGNYNLGGLLLDELLGMSYPSAEFAFKVHRLS